MNRRDFVKAGSMLSLGLMATECVATTSSRVTPEGPLTWQKRFAESDDWCSLAIGPRGCGKTWSLVHGASQYIDIPGSHSLIVSRTKEKMKEVDCHIRNLPGWASIDKPGNAHKFASGAFILSHVWNECPHRAWDTFQRDPGYLFALRYGGIGLSYIAIDDLGPIPWETPSNDSWAFCGLLDKDGKRHHTTAVTYLMTRLRKLNGDPGRLRMRLASSEHFPNLNRRFISENRLQNKYWIDSSFHSENPYAKATESLASTGNHGCEGAGCRPDCVSIWRIA